MKDKHREMNADGLLVEIVKQHVNAVEGTNQLLEGTNKVLDSISKAQSDQSFDLRVIHDFIKTETTRKEAFRLWIIRGFLLVFLTEGMIIAALIRAMGHPSGGIIGAILSGVLSFF